MSILNNEILKTVVTINTLNDKKEFICIGTGFIVGYPNKASGAEDRRFSFIITNRHVLDGVSDFVISVNKKSGGIANFDLNVSNLLKANHLFFHSNSNIDICAISINIDFMVKNEGEVKNINIFKQAFTINEMKSYPIYEGNPVYSIGFPMNLVDRDSKHPIVRGGIISRISNLYNKPKSEKVFLVDSFTFPGNSGSPVFLGVETNSFPTAKAINTNHLIGILNAFIPYSEYLRSTQTNRIRIVEEQNSGLTNVIAVDHIIELVEMFPHIIEANKSE